MSNARASTGRKQRVRLWRWQMYNPPIRPPMQVNATHCDYCAEPPEMRPSGAEEMRPVQVADHPEVSKAEVCDNCRARVAEFVLHSLVNQRGLRELAKRSG